MESPDNKRGQKLYYYLSHLNEKELRDFHAYLSSPLLGNSLQFAQMLLVIQEKVLGTDRTSIDADLFQEALFPHQPLDEKKTKYIRIRLVQMLDKFMDFTAFMDYRADRNAKDIHLLKALHTRGWEKYFLRVHEDVEAAPPIKKDGEYYMYRLWRAVVKGDFLTERILTTLDNEIEVVMDRLDQFFVLSKIKYTCAAKSIELAKGPFGQIEFFDEVMQRVKSKTVYELPEIKAYYHALLMTKYRGERNPAGDLHYDEVKIVLQNPIGFDNSEIQDLFNFAQNYCIEQINLGRGHFSQELREIYDAFLKHGIISELGLISKAFYKNTVVRMCKIGEYQWANQFVEEWKDKIADDPNQVCYFHNKGIIYFQNKEYHKTIELLYHRLHLFEDALYGLSSRIYICRSLWQLREFEWMASNLEAFRQTLIRIKGKEVFDSLPYELFVSYGGRMLAAMMGKPNTTAKKLEGIKTEIECKGQKERLAWLYGALVLELARLRVG